MKIAVPYEVHETNYRHVHLQLKIVLLKLEEIKCCQTGIRIGTKKEFMYGTNRR